MSRSHVEVQTGLLARRAAQLATRAALVLTDENVAALLPAALAERPRHVLVPGEASKSWDELGRLLRALDAGGVDRDGHLVAVGGGVVTDLGGLAASLHRRGISWSAVPTSLVGQVDAALGGKTAVNLGGGKNTVGSFHPPADVVIDPGVLATLPRRHLCAGMAEVLKTALISGPEALDAAAALEPDDFAAATPAAVAVIEACVATKSALVEQDLHDRGPRRALNLGHTFGHAFEALALAGDPADSLLHGEAVALGLLCAARLAAGLPDADRELPARLTGTLRRWGLPTSSPLTAEPLLAEMGRDKKRAGGALRLVLAPRPGRVEIEDAVPADRIRAGLEAVRKSASTS